MNTLPKPYLNLAEQVGDFMEYWGFKQIHGKIWTLVFLNPEPVDANYLIANLKVSKALVSMSISDLLQYNVILEVPKEGPGTQKYRENPDILKVILDVLKNRETKLLATIKKTYKACEKSKTSEHISSDKFDQLGEMVECADDVLGSMVSLANIDLKEISQSLRT